MGREVAPATMTKRWWKSSPRGAASIRRWVCSTEGKSTPLLESIIEDIEAVEKLVLERSGPSQNALLDQVQVLHKRVRRLERHDPPPDFCGPPAEVIPLRLVIERAIRDAVRLCDGDADRAAEGLEIGLATIYRKMKKYGMDVKEIRRSSERKEKRDAGEVQDLV